MNNTKTNLLREFKQLDSDQLTAARIKKALDEDGFIILPNYPVDRENISLTNHSFHKLCEKIGIPISHDSNDTIIWDIKSKPPASDGNGVITYSEHNHEADLHTDSQYSEYPEDYFALLTLSRARCGGGISYLLSVKDIISELEMSSQGREVLDIIQNTTYPFIVPNVFKKQKGEIPEFNYGHILKDGEMRFRVDTIQKALDYDPSFCSSEQVSAFNYLVQLVRTTKFTKQFYLEDNDLIFINNKTMLHGRGSFTDYDRHLLRIRMNKRA